MMDIRVKTMEELQREIFEREANPPPPQTTCATCGGPFAEVVSWVYGNETRPITTETLAGYEEIPGHDHDDNCRCREYLCVAGHSTRVSIRRRCPTAGCVWVGKKTCSCHPGSKVDEWPVLL